MTKPNDNIITMPKAVKPTRRPEPISKGEEMSKQRQVYVVYWEEENGVWKIDPLQTNCPEKIKRMIAQQLLDELGIEIRI